MNNWYKQLFKRVDGNSELNKLKISEETFSENYQGDFSVVDAIPDLEVLATINTRNRAQARLVKISRDPKNYSLEHDTQACSGKNCAGAGDSQNHQRQDRRVGCALCCARRASQKHGCACKS